MDKYEKKLSLEEIRDLKRLNREQHKIILGYSIQSYIETLLDNNDGIELLNIKMLWKYYLMIMNEESYLYNYLLHNYKEINLNSSYDFLDILDNINEKTINYFMELLSGNNIEKSFNTLIETNEYRMLAKGLVMNFDDVKKFLNYPESFWKYVENKVIYLDSYLEKSKDFYSVLVKTDKEDNISDMKIIVPIIVDLFTLLVNIYEFKYAYDLYNNLGNKLIEEEVYEKNAREKEYEFIKKYLYNK